MTVATLDRLIAHTVSTPIEYLIIS